MKKYRFDEPTIQKLLEKQWWNGSAEDLKQVKDLEFRVGEYVNGWESSFRPINTVPTEIEKYRFYESTIQKLLEKQWWNGSEEELKKVKEFEFHVNEYLN